MASQLSWTMRATYFSPIQKDYFTAISRCVDLFLIPLNRLFFSILSCASSQNNLVSCVLYCIICKKGVYSNSFWSVITKQLRFWNSHLFVFMIGINFKSSYTHQCVLLINNTVNINGLLNEILKRKSQIIKFFLHALLFWFLLQRIHIMI